MANVSVLIFLNFILLLIGCTNRDHSWRAAIVGIPSRLVPADVHLLTTSYVVKQTHEPLFYKDKNGSFNSNILDNWERSVDFTKFKLCISKPKYFTEDQVFEKEDLLSHIKIILTNKKMNAFTSHIDGDCINLKFSNPSPQFLEIFAALENSPSKEGSFKNVENGLGNFLVVQINSESIKLKRKNKNEGYIDEVIFHNIESIQNKPEELRSLDDINHLFLNSTTSIPKEKFISFDYTPLKEYVLLINIKDKAAREAIFSCVDIKQLRESAYLDEKNFIDVSTLYPVGIKGGMPGQVERKCNPLIVTKNVKPITFKIWDNVNENGLVKAFDRAFTKNHITIKKENYTELTNDLIAKNYDLFLIVVDTKDPSYVPFFEYIFDN